MSQALPTICAHNYQANPMLPDRTVRCRGCGAVLSITGRDVQNGAWPTPNASPNLVIPSEKAINASYPGQNDAVSLAAAAAL